MIKQIYTYVTDNVTFTTGTGKYAGWRPLNAPDNCITILETGGGNPDYYQKDYVEKLVQVLARGVSYFTARGLAYQVYDFLHGKTGILTPMVDSKRYYINTIQALNVPQSIGQDDKGRFELSTNFLLKIQDAT